MKQSLKNNISKNIYYLTAGIIILVFIAIQISSITNPAWDNVDTWRQPDTYSISCNYYQFNMNPLKPQFNYDGPSENYIQLELQIVPYLSALLFNLIGRMTPIIPRLFSLMFYIGSAIYLCLIAKKFTNKICSLFCTAIYLFMPLSLGMAHAIMPESCAMFFYCGSMYYLLKWYDGKPNLYAIISAIFLSLAIMQKLPVAFIGLLVLMVFIWKKKTGSKLFFLYGAISLIPVIVYYVYAGSVAKFDFVSGIATKHAFTKEIFSIFTKDGIMFFIDTLPDLLGYLPLVTAAVGFIVSCIKKENKFLIFWTISILLELITIVAMIKFGYYLVFFLPIVALFSAVCIYYLSCKKAVIAIVTGVLTFVNIAYISIPYWKAATVINPIIDTAVNVICNYVDIDEPIVVGTVSPSYLSASNRRGWRGNIKYYDYIPQNPKDEVHYFIEHGASYFAVIDGVIEGDMDGSYSAYLQENFEVYVQEENCLIYDLKKGLRNE